MSARLVVRNKQIAHMYVEGYSLAEVGAEFSISRERVRQIITASGITGRHRGARKKVRYLNAIFAAHALVAEGTSTTDTEAQKLGITADALRAAFRRNGLPSIAITPKHGTRHYYQHYKCRCDECLAANRNYQRSLKGTEPPVHGTASAYGNYGCRCIECRMAMRAIRRERKQQRLEREI